MRSTGISISRRLEDTRRHIARWRETRTHRGAPMPAVLWAAAVALARQHGLAMTARTLHLDYGSLKTRLTAATAGRVPAPAFVELAAPRPPGLGPCVIELAARRGRRLRIEVPGLTPADLGALMQLAWGR